MSFNPISQSTSGTESNFGRGEINPTVGGKEHNASTSTTTTTHTQLDYSQQEGLRAFHQQERTQSSYKAALHRYLDAKKKMNRAAQNLDQFNSLHSLPRQLQVNIKQRVTSALLQKHELNDDSLQFIEELKELDALEKQTEKEIKRIVTNIKKRQTKHFLDLTQIDSFINKEKTHMTAYINQYAAIYNSTMNPKLPDLSLEPVNSNSTPNPTTVASSSTPSTSNPIPTRSFPIATAIVEYEKEIRRLIVESDAKDIAATMADLDRKEKERLADNEAQSEILRGAHDGSTMKAMIKKTVSEELSSRSRSVTPSRKRKSMSDADSESAGDSNSIQEFHLHKAFLSTPPKRTKHSLTHPNTSFQSGGEPRNTQVLPQSTSQSNRIGSQHSNRSNKPHKPSHNQKETSTQH